MIIELLVAFGLASIILPAILGSFVSGSSGKVQQQQRLLAVGYLKEGVEAVRSVREAAWANIVNNNTYKLVQNGSVWSLTPGTETLGDFTRSIVVGDVSPFDPSVKRITVTVSWNNVLPSEISSIFYLTRYLKDATYTQTTQADFSAGTLNNVQVTNISGGEVKLANNNKAKWCQPAFSKDSNGNEVTITLPDGPPVAVSAFANATSSAIPNDVFVAVSPYATTSAKLAYLNVTANTDPPVPTLKGTFTLDPSKYSAPGYVPAGLNFNNNFKTKDVKYYTSGSGKIYALLATDMPNNEVVAVQVFDGNTDSYQDPVNKIYKYWTSFNTRIYNPNVNLDTGYKNPSANAADSGGDGDGYGTNPNRAYSSNSSFAVDTNSGNGTGTDCAGADKDKHRYYNYGFGLPSGATVNGVEVRLDAKADSTTGSPHLCIQLSWNGGTTWTAIKSTANLTTNAATYILGGSADTWGRTWTDTNFSDANFRLRVIDVASDINRDFSLDWAGVKVYYSTGASGSDQAPFGYGAANLTVLGSTGYIDSGGYLYTFDLSNIDSKTPATELDQKGCRILLDGYNCSPGTGTDMKYSAGETGASWSDTTPPAHNDCSDGGNIELEADHQLSAVSVTGNTYVYAAVGAGTNPELDIIDVTTPPTGNAAASSSCGRGSDTGWKVLSNLDFDTYSGTEEAANSVYAKSDGTRAYVSSNGGLLRNGGIPDSDQFYIIDTSTKTSPKFMQAWPSTVLNPQPGHYSGTAEKGFYNGDSTDIELYPRRALTVLNGQRAILVGQDGLPNDGIEPHEYQVINIDPNDPTGNLELDPKYCGGVQYLPGFNDLTSVSEADGDNFVYMVANTLEKQLKIIQGGPDSGIYVDSGTFTANPFSNATPSAFNRFSANVTLPANTAIKMQVSVATPSAGICVASGFNYVGPGGDSAAFYTPVGSTISATFPVGLFGTYENPERCFGYKAFLSTTDYNQTPSFNDMTVNYSP